VRLDFLVGVMLENAFHKQLLHMRSDWPPKQMLNIVRIGNVRGVVDRQGSAALIFKEPSLRFSEKQVREDVDVGLHLH